MYNDADDSLRRIFEQLNAPIIRVQKQFDLMNRSVLQSYKGLDIVGQSLEKTLDIFRQQQEINAKAMKYAINETISSQFERAYRVVNQMSSLQNVRITIPDIIFTQIDDLTDLIQDSLPEEDSSDLSSTLTVNPVNQVDNKNKKLTWQEVILLISFLMTLFGFVEDRLKPNVEYVIKQVIEFADKELPDDVTPDETDLIE